MLPILTCLQKRNIGRVPTERNREQLVCKHVWFSCTHVGWREAKWA